ncbi:MAG: MFS transporter [Candidatus Omnitrophica bacterium]|nr:MFS transporter [Candidatus Omnitrophota bacterium]MDD5575179.1 MFS transporter [Candidatus Omnitrophota bacterium]
MFSSLRVREFRIYWVSMFVSLIGSWVQSMGLSWLVFSLTGSAFLMGLVGFLSYLPVSFFSLAAGVYVDRTVKRDLLFATQLAFALSALTLALLVLTGAVKIWHVIVLAALNGFIMSFDAPARHAMIVEVVGRRHLTNAIALNSAAFNSARIIGPAAAGVLIAAIGMSGCFFVNAASFLPVLVALALMKPVAVQPQANRRSVFEDIRESVHLVRRNRSMIFFLGLAGLVSTFGVSYLVLMPIFAQDILHKGAMGLAFLVSSSGVGALIGALNVARLKDDAVRFRVLHASVMMFFLAAMAFSLSRDLVLSCIFLVLAGVGVTGSMSLVNAMLQAAIPDGHRGRIMGLFMMMLMGFIPFGNLLFGALAQGFGVQAVVFVAAAASLLIYLAAWKKFIVPARVHSGAVS